MTLPTSLLEIESKILNRRITFPLNTRILFPRLLVIGISLFFTAAAVAQNSEADSVPVKVTNRSDSRTRLETEPAIGARRPRMVTPLIAPVESTPVVSLAKQADQLLLTAIQSHIGTPYHFNRTGPESFDCSGLVWRAFQDIGIDFQRGPARSYWAMFEAPPQSDEFKFGNLVFFSNLSHVGIVVDAKGFYHSARHGGVMYSPFNDYWLSRIDGFRRVPVEVVRPAAANSPARISKPVVSQALIEQDK
jgi:cell wall-associated NlpC family hydrolase